MILITQNISWTSLSSSLSRTSRSLISFLWDINPISVFTVSITSIYLWRSDFTILIVNIRYSGTSIAVILFDLANPVLFLISNVRQSRLIVWCILRIIRRSFTGSTYLTRFNISYEFWFNCWFVWPHELIVYTRANFLRLVYLHTLTTWKALAQRVENTRWFPEFCY